MKFTQLTLNQRREADIVILATTRTSIGVDTNSEALRFFLHDERITVALSRARHGLFIIGDFNLLKRHALWQRYLEQAIQVTPIVTSRYCECLFSTRRAHNGTLMLPCGDSIIHNDIFLNERWQ